MKYCTSCGKELSDHAKYCTACGTKCEINKEVSTHSAVESLTITEDKPDQENISKESGKKAKVKIVTLLILLLVSSVIGISAILISQSLKSNKSPKYYVRFTGEFSEGLAWVGTYTKTLMGSSKTRYACIDTDGNLQFMLEEGATMPTPYANGVSCYTDASGIYNVINTKGKPVFSSKDRLYDDIIISGEGYHAVYTHKEDFKFSGYEISVIDPNGKMIKIFPDLQSEIPEFIYCGEGIFAYCTWESMGGSKTYDFYNSRTNKWFKVEQIAHNNSLSYIFVDDVAMVERGSGRMLDKPILIYANGAVKELNITDYNYYRYGKISDGGFVFTSYYDKKVNGLYFYEIKTGKVKVLGNYGERVELSRAESLHYDNGHLLLPLLGADGKKYYTILDKSGHSLFEPVPCQYVYSINDNRIGVSYTSGTAILNGNGEIITEDVISPTSLAYNDGWSVYDNNTNYIDTQGNLMFKDGRLANIEK